MVIYGFMEATVNQMVLLKSVSMENGPKICYHSGNEIIGIKFCKQLLGRENVGMPSHILY